MTARLKKLWKTRRGPFVVFVLSLGVCLWFAGNFIADVIYWNDPRHRNQALEPWMTPRYVQHSYGLKPKTVAEVLGIEHPFPGRIRMSEIVALSGRSYDELTEDLRARAEEEKAERRARGNE